MMGVVRGGCGVGAVGGGDVEIAVLNLFFVEQLLDLSRGETKAVMTLFPFKGRRVGARDRREAL